MDKADCSSNGRDSQDPRKPVDPLADLVKSQENVRIAEELVLEEKATLLSTLYEIGAYAPNGARRLIANEIYWGWPNIQVADIAAALSFGRSEWSNVVEPLYSDRYPCIRCGTPLRITSRSKMVELERDYRKVETTPNPYRLRCESCEEMSQQQRDKESLERRQAIRCRAHELATMPYQEYLRSPEWQARRKTHLRSARYRCQLCYAGNTELHVHHRTYERRGDERWSDLLVLCADCHAKHHDKVSNTAGAEMANV